MQCSSINIQNYKLIVQYENFIKKYQSRVFFQVPAGTACPHLKNFDIGQPQPHDIPPLAQNGFFSFEAEFIQQVAKDTGLFTTIKVFHAFDSLLSNLEFRSLSILIAFYSNDLY